MRLLSFLFLALFSFTALMASEVVLHLPVSEGNSRNSEGGFVTLKNGDILYIYTRFGAKGNDHASAELCSRISHDGGRTWSDTDQVVVKNYARMNVMSVSLLRLQDGRIAFFYLEKNAETDCRPVVRFSSDEAATWTEPTHIIPDREAGYYVVNNDRVIQLPSGRILVPICLHNRPSWDKFDRQGAIGTCYSDDGGATWKFPRELRQGIASNGQRFTVQEPGVVALKDGRVLMFIRTNMGELYRAFSKDGGESWSAPEPMGLASPVSPASIERLPGSDLLVLVWNDHTAIPLAERQKRTPLSVAVSRDEGAHWSKALVIEPDPKGWYCYTAMEFTPDALLLGYIAGNQKTGLLSTSLIRRIPLEELQALK